MSQTSLPAHRSRGRRALATRYLLSVTAIVATMPAPLCAADIDRLHWLAGCWASETAEPGSGEQWTRPAGGTMLGVSRTIREGRTLEHEFVIIRTGADGRLAYVAHPSGQAMAEFPLLRAGEREVVFENPAHDFPQRVGYRLGADGRLLGWIEGPRGADVRRVEFPMRRIPCDAPGEASR